LKPKRQMFRTDKAIDIRSNYPYAHAVVCRAENDKLHYMIVQVEEHGGYKILNEYMTNESVEFII